MNVRCSMIAYQVIGKTLVGMNRYKFALNAKTKMCLHELKILELEQNICVHRGSMTPLHECAKTRRKGDESEGK